MMLTFWTQLTIEHFITICIRPFISFCYASRIQITQLKTWTWNGELCIFICIWLCSLSSKKSINPTFLRLDGTVWHCDSATCDIFKISTLLCHFAELITLVDSFCVFSLDNGWVQFWISSTASIVCKFIACV